MRKFFLIIATTISFQNGFVQAMDTQPEQHISSNNQRVSPKELIVGGVLAGCTLEAIHQICKDNRYKNILIFGRNYPGLAIAGISALIGITAMYAAPIISHLRITK